MTKKLPPPFEDVRRKVEAGEPLDVPETLTVLRLTEYAVRTAVASGELPSYRIGKNIRIPASAIKHLLGEG